MTQGSKVKEWFAGYVDAWDRFWFQPCLPYTVCILRLVVGIMLLYSHLVLAANLTVFLGESAWISNETAQQLHNGSFGFSDWGWSYLWMIDSPLWLRVHHGVTMLVTASFAIGFLTRLTGPLTWFLQLMYLHRMTGALFGFDQIVTYTVMYLMLSPCGSWLSVDAKLRKYFAGRRSKSGFLRWLLPTASPSVGANIATRLLQLHLCVIYLFGGLSKARGQSWWDGTAMWLSVGIYEYQSIDMTWLSSYPRIFTGMTHFTLFWEVFYCALIWPRMTRPFILLGAVILHGGIALFLGMITFGVMMIAANGIFVPPELIGRFVDRKGLQKAGVNEPAQSGKK
ncbi:MAG: HTTM domain-containing protein [Rubripirellula sp.]|nr:HTTM domain-containing protein [Rubripirellula sp.]